MVVALTAIFAVVLLAAVLVKRTRERRDACHGADARGVQRARLGRGAGLVFERVDPRRPPVGRRPTARPGPVDREHAIPLRGFGSP